jgi:hypothetical protein
MSVVKSCSGMWDGADDFSLLWILSWISWVIRVIDRLMVMKFLGDRPNWADLFVEIAMGPARQFLPDIDSTGSHAHYESHFTTLTGAKELSAT